MFLPCFTLRRKTICRNINAIKNRCGKMHFKCTSEFGQTAVQTCTDYVVFQMILSTIVQFAYWMNRLVANGVWNYNVNPAACPIQLNASAVAVTCHIKPKRPKDSHGGLRQARVWSMRGRPKSTPILQMAAHSKRQYRAQLTNLRQCSQLPSALFACMYVYMQACMYACMCASMRVCIYGCMHAHVHIWMHAGMYGCMYVWMYVFRYVYIFVYFCVCDSQKSSNNSWKFLNASPCGKLNVGAKRPAVAASEPGGTPTNQT